MANPKKSTSQTETDLAKVKAIEASGKTGLDFILKLAFKDTLRSPVVIAYREARKAYLSAEVEARTWKAREIAALKLANVKWPEWRAKSKVEASDKWLEIQLELVKLQAEMDALELLANF